MKQVAKPSSYPHAGEGLHGSSVTHDEIEDMPWFLLCALTHNLKEHVTKGLLDIRGTEKNPRLNHGPPIEVSLGHKDNSSTRDSGRRGIG